MNDISALDGKTYTALVKSSLRDEVAWRDLTEPVLVERTRQTLEHMIESIDGQILRVEREGRMESSDVWLGKIKSLRRMCRVRLEAMTPSDPGIISGSKEARAWRAFSARLAGALAENDPTALDRLKTPYGGLTAREWLIAREGARA